MDALHENLICYFCNSLGTKQLNWVDFKDNIFSLQNLCVGNCPLAKPIIIPFDAIYISSVEDCIHICKPKLPVSNNSMTSGSYLHIIVLDCINGSDLE